VNSEPEDCVFLRGHRGSRIYSRERGGGCQGPVEKKGGVAGTGSSNKGGRAKIIPVNSQGKLSDYASGSGRGTDLAPQGIITGFAHGVVGERTLPVNARLRQTERWLP